MTQQEHTSQPLVSVIIPCYKQAHFLGEAIESVLRQTYPEYEIIVVDDGSPDHTAEVVAQYPGVRLISQKNAGVSAARNKGISVSCGEYLSFLDADDRLRPGALEAGVECISKYPESAFVFGQYIYISEDGEPLSAPKMPYDGGDIYLELLDRNCIEMGATVLYRRDVFDSVGGFKTNLRAAEDYDLYLRIARLFPCYHYDQIVAEYRKYGTSVTKDLTVMLGTTISVLRSQRKYISGDKKYEEAYRAGLRSWRECYGEPLYLRTARGMWVLSEWKSTLRRLWCLLRYYPQVITIHVGSRLNNMSERLKNGLRIG
jgi:glycosyltransferase involved in cell wall biosynthesis